KACSGLGIELPTLLVLVITDALPAWILRAGRSQRQLEAALARLEQRHTPELAVWETYRRRAPASAAARFEQLGRMIEEGVVALELDSDVVPSLTLDPTTPGAPASRDEDTATRVIGSLVADGALTADGPSDQPVKRWRLNGDWFFSPSHSYTSRT